MVVNKKKSAIRLSVETPLPKSLQEIPRMDDLTYKYLEFEMKGKVNRKEMLVNLEERINESLRGPQEEWKYLRRGTGSSMSTRTS